MKTAIKALVLALGVLIAWPLRTAFAEESLAYAGRPECTPSNSERPYLCDIGKPLPLSLRSFQQIMARNRALRTHVARLGMPDWAEIQKVYTDAPWTNYEIRIYYRDYDRMFAFARAFILEIPEVTMLRYQGPIPPGKFAAVQSVQVSNPDNADADALRAERAAELAEGRAEAAERNAQQAEAIAQHASNEFKESLVKH